MPVGVLHEEESGLVRYAGSAIDNIVEIYICCRVIFIEHHYSHVIVLADTAQIVFRYSVDDDG